jgi:heme/copper-type cytochrome/quinol oxidase subunit 2
MTLSDADSSAAVAAVISVLMIALLASAIIGVIVMTAASVWNAGARRMTQPAPPDDSNP